MLLRSLIRRNEVLSNHWKVNRMHNYFLHALANQVPDLLPALLLLPLPLLPEEVSGASMVRPAEQRFTVF